MGDREERRRKVNKETREEAKGEDETVFKKVVYQPSFR